MNLTGIGRRIAAGLLVAACGALLFGGLSGCGGKKQQGFAGSGTLEATEVTVAAQTAGQILRLAKDEGDAVAAGDTLALIDVEKLMLQRRQLLASVEEIRANRKPVAETVRQAADNLENIEKSYRRISALFEQGTATQQQYDDANTKYRVAQSQLESAKAQGATLDAREETVRASIALLDRQIRDGAVIAPLAGVVTEKYVESGEVVATGSAVFKIADTKRFWIKVYVSERDLGLFAVGSAAEVRVDAHPEPLAGEVSWVSPEAEFTPKNVETKDARAELVYAVKVSIENPPGVLKIGMPAEVHLK
ncbi:MAG: efflux RND transporter periplasmic adaptor subunit [Candidatus Krumholzibacteria bacterium]|nr:efflux RND transporter periplasmic adaptor subunit [Candidatus Krumholzibacteria bacterium]